MAAFIVGTGQVRAGESLGWDVESWDNPSGKMWTPAQVEQYAVALKDAGIGFDRQFVYLNHNDVRNQDWSRVVALGLRLWVSNYGPNDGETIPNTLIAWWDEAWLHQYTSQWDELGEPVDMSVAGDAGSVFTVKWLQDGLNKVQGSGLVVDGRLGPKTASAVWRFQTAQGLKIDGIAGSQTLAALKAALA